jgi:hypothetical protein
MVKFYIYKIVLYIIYGVNMVKFIIYKTINEKK